MTDTRRRGTCPLCVEQDVVLLASYELNTLHALLCPKCFISVGNATVDKIKDEIITCDFGLSQAQTDLYKSVWSEAREKRVKQVTEMVDLLRQVGKMFDVEGA